MAVMNDNWSTKKIFSWGQPRFFHYSLTNANENLVIYISNMRFINSGSGSLKKNFLGDFGDGTSSTLAAILCSHFPLRSPFLRTPILDSGVK